MNLIKSIAALGLALALSLAAWAVLANSDAIVSDRMSRSGFVLENGLAIPAFDPVKGRMLFASKGCVVCHSVNGVGGEDATSLSHENMDHPMNAFDFAAKMWRGAAVMIAMQEDELDGQIEFDGDELAAIIAFIHDAEEQKLFSKADIPEEILELMHEAEAEHEEGEEAHDDGG